VGRFHWCILNNHNGKEYAKNNTLDLWSSCFDLLGHRRIQPLQKQEAIVSPIQDIHLDVKVQMSKDALDAAIQHYNQAIKQFPASLIAALFSFKPYIHSIDKSE
jgi:hypothetical protein